MKKRAFGAIYCLSFVCKNQWNLIKERRGLVFPLARFISGVVWTGVKARIIWCIYRIWGLEQTIINLAIKLFKPIQSTERSFNLGQFKNTRVHVISRLQKVLICLTLDILRPSLHLPWTLGVGSDLLFELQLDCVLQLFPHHSWLLSVLTILAVLKWTSDQVISITITIFRCSDPAICTLPI